MTKAEAIIAEWHEKRRWKENPLVVDFRAIRGKNSLGAAMQAYDAATDTEKKLIKHEMRTKLVMARSRAEEWSPQTRKLAKQYFGMEPDDPNIAGK